MNPEKEGESVPAEFTEAQWEAIKELIDKRVEEILEKRDEYERMKKQAEEEAGH